MADMAPILSDMEQRFEAVFDAASKTVVMAMTILLIIGVIWGKISLGDAIIAWFVLYVWLALLFLVVFLLSYIVIAVIESWRDRYSPFVRGMIKDLKRTQRDAKKLKRCIDREIKLTERYLKHR